MLPPAADSLAKLYIKSTIVHQLLVLDVRGRHYEGEEAGAAFCGGCCSFFHKPLASVYWNIALLRAKVSTVFPGVCRGRKETLCSMLRATRRLRSCSSSCLSSGGLLVDFHKFL